MRKTCSAIDTNDIITMIILIKSLQVHKYMRYHKAIMVIAKRAHYFDDYIILRTSHLREKCPDSEFFWFVFSSIRTEYREIQRYSVQRRENTNQKQKFNGRGFKSRSGQLSIAASKNLSAVNTIYIYIYI